MVSSPHGLLLVGTPSLLWYAESAFAPAPPRTAPDSIAFAAAMRRNFGKFGLLFQPGRGVDVIERPELRAPPIQPQAVRTANGALHVVWLTETRDPGSRKERATLWYAEQRNGRWGAPSPLFAADRINWRFGSGALLARGNDLHVVASHYQAELGGGIVYARRLGEQWHVVQTPVAALPVFTTAVLSGADSLTVMFAAGDAKARVANGTHLWVVRPATGDSAWPAPARVQWSGLANANWVTLVRGMTGGSLHELRAIWALDWPGSNGADSVFTMTSRDDGSTWSVPVGASVPITVAMLRAVVDVRGDTHVVALAEGGADGADGDLWYVRVQGGRWGAMTKLPFGPVASIPTLSTIGRDSLLLVWGRAVNQFLKAGGRADAPVGYYAMLLPRCTVPAL